MVLWSSEDESGTTDLMWFPVKENLTFVRKQHPDTGALERYRTGQMTEYDMLQNAASRTFTVKPGLNAWGIALDSEIKVWHV